MEWVLIAIIPAVCVVVVFRSLPPKDLNLPKFDFDRAKSKELQDRGLIR